MVSGIGRLLSADCNRSLFAGLPDCLESMTYQLAVTVYKNARGLSLPYHLKEQLLRASCSVVLNLAEGRGRSTNKDQKRFFQIAFGSIREVQAIFDLSDNLPNELKINLDYLAASTYKLIKSIP